MISRLRRPRPCSFPAPRRRERLSVVRMRAKPRPFSPREKVPEGLSGCVPFLSGQTPGRHPLERESVTFPCFLKCRAGNAVAAVVPKGSGRQSQGSQTKQLAESSFAARTSAS